MTKYYVREHYDNDIIIGKFYDISRAVVMTSLSDINLMISILISILTSIIDNNYQY